MEFAPAFLFGCTGAGAAWFAHRRATRTRRTIARDSYAAALVELKDGASEACLMAGHDGTIVSVNDAAADLFRWRASDLIGQRVQHVLFLPGSGGPLKAMAERYRQQQELSSNCLEIEGRRKDGGVFTMALRFSDIRLGKDMFILITARDLTQTILNQQGERDLELAIGTLQFASYPIFLLDAEGCIARHNSAFEDFTGYRAEELHKFCYSNLLSDPEPWNKASSGIWELLLQGETHSEDAVWKLKDGSEAEVCLVMRKLETDGGSSRYAVIAAMPVDTAPSQPDVDPAYEFIESGEQAMAEPPEPEFFAAPEAARKIQELPFRGLPIPDRSLDEYPQMMESARGAVERGAAGKNSAAEAPEEELSAPVRAFEPGDFIIPTMGRPGSFSYSELPKRITPLEARQMEADHGILANEFEIPERQTPVFREMNLNDQIRLRKPGLARMMGTRVRLSTTLDLALDNVWGDPALIDEICLNLAWIARHGMAAGGKVSISTSTVNLEKMEARGLASLRGGSYAVLAFRYQPATLDSELHALLFTPFHEASSGATLQATLPGLHALLRANGANLLVEGAADDGALVRVYLPRAQQNTRASRATSHD